MYKIDTLTSSPGVAGPVCVQQREGEDAGGGGGGGREWEKKEKEDYDEGGTLKKER